MPDKPTARCRGVRLTVLDADNAAVVGLAAVTGFVLSPLWYARLGLALGQFGRG